VQQHLGRQAGVAKVDVSLVDGKVTVYPKEDSRFDPAAIFKAVYDSGVSVAEMTITASGELLNDPNKGLVFKITNTQMFEVKANDLSERLKDQIGSGKAVRLRGLLYKKPAGKAKRKAPTSMPLEVLEILS
jgi:hypothetical protein